MPNPFTEVRFQKENPQVVIRTYFFIQKKRRSSTRFTIQALLSHPLVLSFARASRLIDEYLKAHAAYVGEWN